MPGRIYRKDVPFSIHSRGGRMEFSMSSQTGFDSSGGSCDFLRIAATLYIGNGTWQSALR